jgi:hypothetical protein
MRLPSVITLVVTAGLAAALAGSAAAHSPNGTATYFRVRPDMRLCPSPACGGWWAHRVNRSITICSSGLPGEECYAAGLDLTTLKLTDERRTALERAIATGTTLLRGRLERRPGSGPPPLDKLGILVATEAWLRYGHGRLGGSVFRVEDNGVRCVRAPCFSLHVSVLNTTVHQDVSSLDLRISGASPAAVRRARAALARTGVIVEGRVGAGARAEGKTLRAGVFWLRAA